MLYVCGIRYSNPALSSATPPTVLMSGNEYPVATVAGSVRDLHLCFVYCPLASLAPCSESFIYSL